MTQPDPLLPRSLPQFWCDPGLPSHMPSEPPFLSSLPPCSLARFLPLPLNTVPFALRLHLPVPPHSDAFLVTSTFLPHSGSQCPPRAASYPIHALVPPLPPIRSRPLLRILLRAVRPSPLPLGSSHVHAPSPAHLVWSHCYPAPQLVYPVSITAPVSDSWNLCLGSPTKGSGLRASRAGSGAARDAAVAPVT